MTHNRAILISLRQSKFNKLIQKAQAIINFPFLHNVFMYIPPQHPISFVIQSQYLPQLTNNIPRTVSTFAFRHILPHRISKLPTIHTKRSLSLRLQHLPYRYTIPNINSLTRKRIISNLPDISQCSSGSSNCPKSVGYGYQSINLKHNLLNQPMILSTLQTWGTY